MSNKNLNLYYNQMVNNDLCISYNRLLFISFLFTNEYIEKDRHTHTQKKIS